MMVLMNAWDPGKGGIRIYDVQMIMHQTRVDTFQSYIRGYKIQALPS